MKRKLSWSMLLCSALMMSSFAKAAESNLKISGHLAPTLAWIHDGKDKTRIHRHWFLADNNYAQSRIRAKYDKMVNEDFTVGGEFNLDFAVNNLWGVTTETPIQTTSRDANSSPWLRIRVIEGTFTSKKFGGISAGWGNSPSYGVGFSPAAKTTMTSTIWVATSAAAVSFRQDDADRTKSTYTVANAFNYVDGGRVARLRYDTPSFKGAKFSVAFLHDGGWDYALRYGRDMEKFKLDLKVGHFVKRTFPGLNGEAVASVSASHSDHTMWNATGLHKESGFNLSASGGINHLVDNSRNNETYWLFKLGKVTPNAGGELAVSGDYFTGRHHAKSDTTSTAFGLNVAQHVKDWNAQVYAGWKNYKFEGGGLPTYKAINTLLLGTRINF